MNRKDGWVFYLKLSKDLPEEFLSLDQEFKKEGKSLVPITIKTLLDHGKRNNSVHVVILVRSLKELEYYNAKVRKAVKFLMMNRRLHLYIASSFATVGDPSIMRRDHYYFERLPVATKHFVETTCYEIDRKETSMLKWPGGIRPRLSIAG